LAFVSLLKSSHEAKVLLTKLKKSFEQQQQPPEEDTSKIRESFCRASPSLSLFLNHPFSPMAMWCLF